MQLSNKQQRQLVRVVHLIIGSALGFLVYAPPHLTEGLRLIIQVGVFPVVVLTGLWLWYGTRILSTLRHRQSTTLHNNDTLTSQRKRKLA